MRFSHRLFGLWWILFGILAALQSASAEETRRLDVLARTGPWPVSSHLIEYRGRIWFSNAVKGRNHNSADLYSLDPSTGDTRYERHLFSQDAGTPLIYRGLLYWPYEDSRLSLGYGHVAVTNGQEWRKFTIPTAQIFHTHSLDEWRGALVAVTSAWRAGLQASHDGGVNWTRFYDHPTPTRRISRLQSPVVLKDQLFLHLRDPKTNQLVSFDTPDPLALDSWPKTPARSLINYHGEIFGIAGPRATAQIWRSDGNKSRVLTGLPVGGTPIDLFAGNERLWVLFASGKSGYVASSPTGTSWRIDATFEGGRSIDMIVANGQILVGGAGVDGKGIVWGTRIPQLPSPATGPLKTLPEPTVANVAGNIDWSDQAAKLKSALLDPANFRNHSRGGLREIVQDIVALSPPDKFLSDHLLAPMPDTSVDVIGGQYSVPARHIGQWILLWGMTSNANARVPVALLKPPWTVPPQPSEKYFDPVLAALFTIAHNRQTDHATIAALIARLTEGSDPLWLTGDIIGTLNAITGQKFGYDIPRWQAWWQRQPPD